jgi:hypothetical protein
LWAASGKAASILHFFKCAGDQWRRVAAFLGRQIIDSMGSFSAHFEPRPGLALPDCAPDQIKIGSLGIARIRSPIVSVSNKSFSDHEFFCTVFWGSPSGDTCGTNKNRALAASRTTENIMAGTFAIRRDNNATD